ncbi:MAG: FkbM family methyltransferase [Rickettsiales bacterium]|jgi:FkbM family methyltransferase|nr:FkbM family methyltransferase [Rickettsiales bacterium]
MANNPSQPSSYERKNLVTIIVATLILSLETLFGFYALERRTKRFSREMRRTLKMVITKLSMDDDAVVYVKGVKFWVPNFPADFIQRVIVAGEFFEQETLEVMDKYLSEDSVVFDIGANLGNHSLYWAKVSQGGRGVRRVHAFEPVDSTFAILKKNMELNGLAAGDRVVINNVALGARESRASIDFYHLDNIGGTGIKTDADGTIRIISLDDYVASGAFRDEKIDLLKIDVEGFEDEVLAGARKTLEKYGPKIFIEAWENNFDKVNELLLSLGYGLEKYLGGADYLYSK